MEHYKITGDLLTISFKGACDGKYNRVSVRGDVDAFSKRSASRMSRYLRSCTSDYRYFVTLTYPNDESTWFGYRNHFRAFIERARRSGYVGPTSSLFWFVEFQKRGAPHFHIFSTCHIGKHWLSKNWYEVVGSGDRKHLNSGTNIERIRGGRDACRSYARKYAAKNDQKTVPALLEGKKLNKRGDLVKCTGRWWGVVGVRSVVAAVTSFSSNIDAGSDDLDFIKKLDSVINQAFEHQRCKYFTYMEARCFEFRDERTARYVYYLIKEHRERKQCRLGAATSLIVQNHVRGMKKRSFAWDVMQYRKAKAMTELLPA